MWNEKIIEYIIKNIKQFNETISIIKIFHINEIKNQQFDENDSKNTAEISIRNPAILTEIDEVDVITENNIIKIVNKKNKQAEQNELNWMTNQYFKLNNFIIKIMFI